MRTRALTAAAMLLVLLGGCAGARSGGGSTSAKPGVRVIDVVASAYPLSFLSDQVGQDHVAVRDLTPPGVEPHDAELTPKDIDSLTRASLVIAIGEGFQPEIEKAIEELPKNGRDVYLVMTGLAPMLAGGRATSDPHVWLDPSLMTEIGRAVSERLSLLEPGESENFKMAFEVLRRRLQELDSAYRLGLSKCKRRTILVTHDAFGHLARRYDLTQVSLTGLSPHSEPTPASLVAAKNAALETGSTTVFVEPGSESKSAEVLASEIGGVTAVLDPIEVQRPGEDYFSSMRANLAALRKALECE